MIFELMEECNDKDTVTVIIDNCTYNQILRMMIVEAYHKGLRQEKPDERNEWEEE